MNSHEKALGKGKGSDSKILNLLKGKTGKLNEKGKKPKKEFGAKNNDSQED